MPSHKRLIIACDGTWVNSDNGFVRDSWLPWKTTGTLAVSSNITRICRALKPETEDGIQQIIYYQAGLASQGSFWSYVGGFVGAGVSENIREAYAFLCNNYDDGDEIILVGFSRGAFIARSIAGLISSVGILTRHGLGAFYPIFQDWENQNTPGYKPQHETHAWPIKGRPSFKASGQAYFKRLANEKCTHPIIPPIKAVAVFDTVGSLGVPTIRILGIPLYTHSTREFAFTNTEVPSNIEHAYQALAIDEQRAPFAPTVWETPDAKSGAILKELKQTWFPGVHSGVGGGYDDTSISDLTLAWMVTQLTPFLEFDNQYVLNQQKQNVQFYKDKQTKDAQVQIRTWAMGWIQPNDGGLLNTLTGRQVRTPGEYHATSPETGKVLEQKLVKTCEFIHPSVRYRRDADGQGVTKNWKDHSVYRPAALNGWDFAKSGSEDAEEIGGKQWKGYGKWVKKDKSGKVVQYIVEDTIDEETVEKQMLDAWPGVEQKLYPTVD